jgi:radical SAM-linked protein
LTVRGDIRFLSHHELMRLIERAAARAKLPLKYSQGFNPRPRIALALPRPVGVASECELLTFELDRPPADDWTDRLSARLDPGLRILRAAPLPGRRPPRVISAAYEMPLDEGEGPAVAARLAELNEREAWSVRRPSRPKRKGRPVAGRTIDIRSGVRRLQADGDRLRFELSAEEGTTARPADVIRLLGLAQEPGPGGASADCGAALARLTRVRLEAHTPPPEDGQRNPQQ